jgi:hypothetical protein
MCLSDSIFMITVIAMFYLGVILTIISPLRFTDYSG